MNLIKFITESGLVPLQKGQDTFIPIYRIYFDMLQGDLYACFVLGELLRLQNSPQAQENDGWMVLTYQTIKTRYYMSKHVWDKAIEALKPLGLISELKQHPRYPDARAGIWHYRVDETALVTAVVTYVAGRESADAGENPSILTTPPSKILTTPPQKFSPILDINILDQKDLSQTCPEDISEVGHQENAGCSMENGGKLISEDRVGMRGKKVDSMPTSTPPPSTAPTTTRKRGASQKADVNHSSDYRIVFGAVARLIFEGSPNNTPQSKRVGLIAGYLWGTNKAMQAPRPDTETEPQKADNICKDVEAFVEWWRRSYPNASLPLDLGKFAHHWLRFWNIRKEAYRYVDIDDVFTSSTPHAQSDPSQMPIAGSALQMLFEGS